MGHYDEFREAQALAERSQVMKWKEQPTLSIESKILLTVTEIQEEVSYIKLEILRIKEAIDHLFKVEKFK